MASAPSFELKMVILERVLKKAGMTDRDIERQKREWYGDGDGDDEERKREAEKKMKRKRMRMRMNEL